MSAANDLLKELQDFGCRCRQDNCICGADEEARKLLEKISSVLKDKSIILENSSPLSNVRNMKCSVRFEESEVVEGSILDAAIKNGGKIPCPQIFPIADAKNSEKVFIVGE